MISPRPPSSFLDDLAEQISSCRRCDGAGIGVVHPQKMYRGLGEKRIMVVGVQPGNSEKTSGQAFSGQAGKRLIQWLQSAGLGKDRESIFRAVYFTSVVKCGSAQIDLQGCAERCFDWLQKQIDFVNPKMLITLGRPPIQLLFECDWSLNELVGRQFVESELTNRLFQVLGDRITIVPLPHPSGMSRWHNDPNNQKLLEAGIGRIRSN